MIYTRLTLLLTALLLAACAITEPTGSTVVEPVTVTRIDDLAPPAAGTVMQDRQATTSVDTWTRLRSGFRLAGAGNERIQKAIEKYSRSPHDVEATFRRGDLYITYILDEVSQRGFPTELALLPFVESGYDPFAYSHGRAAGLWQFIPGTGRMFGLKQDWWFDERRDIIASTTAALDYLGKLHREFDGDWLLALAAYNAGSGNVRSAVRRNRKAGKPVDFWHLKLPGETSVYVPRLLAISAIVRHPASYDISLPPLSPTPVFTAVDTGGQLDIGIAAELAGMETEQLYRLNPGFNRWATHPDGPHRLLVPAEQADRLSESLASLPADKRIKWVRHRIAQGQTLSHIARKYDTTVAVLRDTNELNGTVIRAGRHLLVPVAARDSSQYASVKRQLTPRGSGNKTTYRVRDGDSLWNIARKHSVSVRQVARWNRLGTNSVIRPGQKLVIWTKKAGVKDGQRIRSIRYTVRSGDSLYRIARKFNVTIAELRRWNKLEKAGYLQPGQRLTLYVDVTRLSQS